MEEGEWGIMSEDWKLLSASVAHKLKSVSLSSSSGLDIRLLRSFEPKSKSTWLSGMMRDCFLVRGERESWKKSGTWCLDIGLWSGLLFSTRRSSWWWDDGLKWSKLLSVVGTQIILLDGEPLRRPGLWNGWSSWETEPLYAFFNLIDQSSLPLRTLPILALFVLFGIDSHYLSFFTLWSSLWIWWIWRRGRSRITPILALWHPSPTFHFQ